MGAGHPLERVGLEEPPEGVRSIEPLEQLARSSESEKEPEGQQ